MPCSHASLRKATGKSAGNETVGKLVRAVVPESVFPAFSEMKVASASYRE